ncbi:MAG: hypothetical protein ACP5PQ_05675 [Thermoproteota archaeon]
MRKQLLLSLFFPLLLVSPEHSSAQVRFDWIKHDEWSPIPLAIATIAIIPVAYYISLRRRLKRA